MPWTIFPGWPGGPHAHLEVSLCKTYWFLLQEHDSLMLAWLFSMLLGYLLGGSAFIFCHWSNGFSLTPIGPPHFFPSQNAILKSEFLI